MHIHEVPGLCPFSFTCRSLGHRNALLLLAVKEKSTRFSSSSFTMFLSLAMKLLISSHISPNFLSTSKSSFHLDIHSSNWPFVSCFLIQWSPTIPFQCLKSLLRDQWWKKKLHCRNLGLNPHSWYLWLDCAGENKSGVLSLVDKFHLRMWE